MAANVCAVTLLKDSDGGQRLRGDTAEGQRWRPRELIEGTAPRDDGQSQHLHGDNAER